MGLEISGVTFSGGTNIAFDPPPITVQYLVVAGGGGGTSAPAAPGRTVLTYTAASPLTPSTFTYTA